MAERVEYLKGWFTDAGLTDARKVRGFLAAYSDGGSIPRSRHAWRIWAFHSSGGPIRGHSTRHGAQCFRAASHRCGSVQS